MYGVLTNYYGHETVCRGLIYYAPCNTWGLDIAPLVQGRNKLGPYIRTFVPAASWTHEPALISMSSGYSHCHMLLYMPQHPTS